MNIRFVIFCFLSIKFVSTDLLAAVPFTVRSDSKTSVLISDRHAAKGLKSIKLCDHPNAKAKGYPYIYLQSQLFSKRSFRFSSDFRFEPKAECSLQFRSLADGNGAVGPYLIFRNGTLTVTGIDEKARFKVGQWIHLELLLHLNRGNFDINVVSDNAVVMMKKNVPLDDQDFNKCMWIGFVSSGKEESCYYLDNIIIEQE